MTRKNIAFHTFMAVLLLSSCQYKDFDDYAGTLPVPVIADYSHAECDSVPVATRSIFYPATGVNEPFYCDLRDSARVDLPTGTYTVFAYNNDSEINRTRNFAYREGSPVIFTDRADYRGLYKADSLDHTIYYDYPDSTYAYYGTTTVAGLPEDVTPTDNRVVLKMRKVTRGVDITVRGMKNTDYIKSLRMSLDGVQHEYSPQLSYANSNVAIVADGSLDSTGVLRSSFTIFGASNTGHIVRVHLNTGLNHKVLLFDVTEQVNAQLGTAGHIKIDITTDYNVKDDIPESNIFDVSVDDWEDINIPIDGDK